MLRKTALLTIVMVVSAAAGAWCAAVTPVEFLYNGNIDPVVANSAGQGLRFTQMGTALGHVSADPAANDGVAWRVTDTSTVLSDFYALEPEFDIDYIDGATIVGRIKVGSDTHGAGGEAGGNLGILDSSGNGSTATMHWGGATGHVIETQRGEQVAAAGNGDYRIFRMTIKGRFASGSIPYSETFDYPDGALVGNGDWLGDATASQISVVSTDPNHPKAAQVTAGSDPEGKYRFAHQYLMATDPGSGIEVTCKVKGGLGAGTAWSLHANDPYGVNLARWYGAVNAARPRIGGYSTPGQSICSNQYLSGGWDTLRIVIKTSEQRSHFYYTAAGGTEAFLCTLDYTAGGAQQPQPMLGSIAIERTYNSGATGSILIDDITVNGTPVSANARIVKVFVDEASMPAMELTGAAAKDFTRNGFGFGVLTAAARQDVSFDWISGTNRGAFEPGQEVAVLGHSLIPGTPTVAETIIGAKQAPMITSVVIPEAVVACAIHNEQGMQTGFGIQSPGKEHGIRVASTVTAPAGHKVKIAGATNDVSGERIIEGGYVEDLLDNQPIPTPVTMSNKATGGGAFFAQPAVYAVAPGMKTDTFDYPDGALVSCAFWSGGSIAPASASQIAVEGGEVKITGGVTVGQNTFAHNFAPVPVTADDSEIKVTARAGSGTYNFFWQFCINDGAGYELGRWYGTSYDATPRDPSGAGSALPIAADGTELKFKVNFTARKAFWYVDGVEVWNRTLVPQAANSIGGVSFNWMSNTEAVGGTAYFDDVVTPWDQAKIGTGTSTVGLFTQICGRVKSVHITGVDANDYIYIDDGSGLADPQGTGIRCTKPSYAGADTVSVGDFVVASGVMGVMNRARILRAWDMQVQ